MATISTPAGIGGSVSAKEAVIVMGAGVGCIILLYWLGKREVTNAAGAVKDAVVATATAAGNGVKNVAISADSVANAANAVNPANLGVNAVKTLIYGTDSWSLGSWIYDKLNPEDPQG